MSTDNNFWNDELVKEFANELFIDKMADDYEINKFKKSKQHPQPIQRDWEVVTCKAPNGAIHDFISEEKVEKDGGMSCFSRGCEAHSVKVLSTNEVWTVGDICQYNLKSYTPQDRITGFEVANNGDMLAVGKWAGDDRYMKVDIKDLKKVPQTQSIPSTESNIVTNYKLDEAVVNFKPEFEKSKDIVTNTMEVHGTDYEERAINANAPLLSYNDIISCCEFCDLGSDYGHLNLHKLNALLKNK